jgi:hypothetical protein
MCQFEIFRPAQRVPIKQKFELFYINQVKPTRPALGAVRAVRHLRGEPVALRAPAPRGAESLRPIESFFYHCFFKDGNQLKGEMHTFHFRFMLF